MKQLLAASRFAQIILGGAAGFYLLTGLALLFASNWFFQTLGYFPPRSIATMPATWEHLSFL